MNIKGLLETSLSDWAGRLVAVVFLGGCNFRCPYCHNSELVARPEELPGRPVEYVLQRLAPSAAWLDGVVVSGGEPTLDPELPRLCEAFGATGFPVKLDTNGSRPEVLARLIQGRLIQAVSMDIKAPWEEPLLHHRLAGVKADLADLGRSVELLLASGLEVEFRTTVVPGLLDESHLRAICARIKGARRYKINPFWPRTCLDEAFLTRPPLPEAEQRRLQALVDELLAA